MEPLAVAIAIVLASVYLVARPLWLNRRGRKPGGCGNGCACPPKAPKNPR